MEALHPATFKPQLPAGYESAAAVFHRWVLGQFTFVNSTSVKPLRCSQASERSMQYRSTWYIGWQAGSYCCRYMYALPQLNYCCAATAATAAAVSRPAVHGVQFHHPEPTAVDGSEEVGKGYRHASADLQV
jgi:hypothetical protein